MTKLTQRGRAGVTTDHEIRGHAHTLLQTDSQDAVTLRAIARALGITAPALYPLLRLPRGPALPQTGTYTLDWGNGWEPDVGSLTFSS